MVFVSSLPELENTKVRDSRQDVGNDPGEGMGAWKRRVRFYDEVVESVTHVKGFEMHLDQISL